MSPLKDDVDLGLKRYHGRQRARRTGKGVTVMYRTVWNCAFLAAGVAGVWASVATWSLGGAVCLFLFLSATAACIRLVMTEDAPWPGCRRAGWSGLGWGAACLAALGLVAGLGLAGLTMVALLTLVSPAVLTSISKRGRQRPRSLGVVIPRRGYDSWSDRGAQDRDDATQHLPQRLAVTGPPLMEAPWMTRPIDSMDDGALCFAWRTSYVALQRPVPLVCRLRIVERRQQFLDELERRNAPGLEAWLESGARAAGDPTKYIASPHRHPHRHNRL